MWSTGHLAVRAETLASTVEQEWECMMSMSSSSRSRALLLQKNLSLGHSTSSSTKCYVGTYSPDILLLTYGKSLFDVIGSVFTLTLGPLSECPSVSILRLCCT